MHTPSLADYTASLDAGDREGVAALMLGSANKLASIGADFLICPDNTVHQAFDLVAPHSPLPWLHIAEVVADEAVARGYKRLALTGTAWLVGSEVYPDVLSARGLDCVRPDDAACAEINRIIMDELVHSRIEPSSLTYFQQVFEGMKAEGCEAAILGCTEIPLLFGDDTSPLPTLDSTRLLARAALRRACGAGKEAAA